ncbi:MAG: SHOCT domain-containing protein [Thaumarchaeota archaeon]|nr:SHOCT domain-containing protein [Nitrososphaerota archaeon]
MVLIVFLSSAREMIFVSQALPIVVIILTTGIVILAVVRKRMKKESKGNSSLDILEKRYASGEISEEEFKKMKKDLE